MLLEPLSRDPRRLLRLAVAAFSPGSTLAVSQQNGRGSQFPVSAGMVPETLGQARPPPLGLERQQTHLDFVDLEAKQADAAKTLAM